MKWWWCCLSIVLGLLVVLGATFSPAFNSRLFPPHIMYDDSPMKQSMPKIIHQTWKTNDVNEEQRQSIESWKKHYPKYQHVLWTDKSIEEFVHTHFSWYLQTWNKLRPFIKKVDTVRYMWMFHYGGIYADIDMDSIKRFSFEDPKYEGSAMIPVQSKDLQWEKGSDASSPALLTSSKGHPFWIFMLNSISKRYHLPVLKATGPIALADALLEYTSDHSIEHKKIVLLSEAKFGIGSFKYLKEYAYHFNASTWV